MFEPQYGGFGARLAENLSEIVNHSNRGFSRGQEALKNSRLYYRAGRFWQLNGGGFRLANTLRHNDNRGCRGRLFDSHSDFLCVAEWMP